MPRRQNLATFSTDDVFFALSQYNGAIQKKHAGFNTMSSKLFIGKILD
jgi:hypothetical protein